MEINIKINISTNEIFELLEKHSTRNDVVFKTKNKNEYSFFYKDEPENIIRINDIVEILPAENCVTNSDKIKYDERIDGLKCFVVKFNCVEKTIRVCDFNNMSNSFVVHPTWLKFISRK